MFYPLLAFFAGALLPLAFAPFKLYALAFFAPATLLYTLLQANKKQAFWRGYLFGLGLFSVGSSWIYISIHQFGNASSFLAILITFLFISLLALFYALLGYLLIAIKPNLSLPFRILALFPALWLLGEWLRSTLWGGFPWLLLGYAQLYTPLSHLAPIFGVFGLSLFTVWISGALILLAQKNTLPLKLLCTLLIALPATAGFLLKNHEWTVPSQKPLSISIVQANIPQTVKWEKDSLPSILQRYLSLSQPHLNTDLLIWPEAAIPVFPSDIPSFMQSLQTMLIAHQTHLITGAPILTKTGQYYNGLLLLGKNPQSYFKQHLVPFGEYTPFGPFFAKIMQALQIPMSDFSKGPPPTAPLEFNHILLAPFICYEIAFPISAAKVLKHSQLIINILDDSWFGRSIALTQQFEMTQMRALESGRYALVAANTGISGIINAEGKILATAPINQTAVLTGHVKVMNGETPLLRWNYYPVLFIVLVLGLMVVLG